MTSPGFRLYRNASRRLTIELAGEIDESTALYCERETRADLALVADASLRVVWDFSAVTGYSLDARVVLVRLQQFLTSKAERTAYVAVEATARSLALWAARMGDEARACIAADRDAAEAWLVESDNDARTAAVRLDGVRSVRVRRKTAAS
jgi:hypothetical protein